jgi:hypothetical protein
MFIVSLNSFVKHSGKLCFRPSRIWKVGKTCLTLEKKTHINPLVHINIKRVVCTRIKQLVMQQKNHSCQPAMSLHLTQTSRNIKSQYLKFPLCLKWCKRLYRSQGDFQCSWRWSSQTLYDWRYPLVSIYARFWFLQRRKWRLWLMILQNRLPVTGLVLEKYFEVRCWEKSC